MLWPISKKLIIQSVDPGHDRAKGPTIGHSHLLPVVITSLERFRMRERKSASESLTPQNDYVPHIAYRTAGIKITCCCKERCVRCWC